MPETTDEQLEQLRARFQQLFAEIERRQVRIQNVHVLENKLYVRGAAPGEDAKNAVWDVARRLDPEGTGLGLELISDSGRGSSTAGDQTYIVQNGDTLESISQQFYGHAGSAQRILGANEGKVEDPSRLQPGVTLVIPA